MKFQIVVKQGTQQLHLIEGQRDVRKSQITLEELSRLPEVEALLERLTGFRFHIQEMC